MAEEPYERHHVFFRPNFFFLCLEPGDISMHQKNTRTHPHIQGSGLPGGLSTKVLAKQPNTHGISANRNRCSLLSIFILSLSRRRTASLLLSHLHRPSPSQPSLSSSPLLELSALARPLTHWLPVTPAPTRSHLNSPSPCRVL